MNLVSVSREEVFPLEFLVAQAPDVVGRDGSQCPVSGLYKMSFSLKEQSHFF